MMGRALAETAVSLVLTLILGVLGSGVLQLINGTDAATAFFDSGPRFFFGTLLPALILWLLLVLIGNIRNRHRAPGWKLLTNGVSTLIVAVLHVIGWALFAGRIGEWGSLLFGIAVAAAVIFLLAAAVSFLITHLLLFTRPAA